MSDTPRTEAACYTFHSEDVTGCSSYDEYVPASLSRELERENVALRADVLEQCMLNAKGSEREYSLRGRIEQLERENAALREDKERLDWLGEKCCGASNSERYLPFRVYWQHTTIRAAIDAARAKEAKP